MCVDCGCGVTTERSVLHADDSAAPVLDRLLAENDRVAAHNREHFDTRGVVCINLMSSPGAGKTTLLETTIDALRNRLRIAVVEGDLETENDAARIRAHGVPAVQITTGTACHLDAAMLHTALHALPLASLDLLFVENVGNLVCPASFDIGQHENVVLLSVPEGDDKPAKYPVMFRAADLVLLTKADFMPLCPDFSAARAQRYLHDLGNDAPVLELSTRSGHGVSAWIDWLERHVDSRRRAARQVTAAS